MVCLYQAFCRLSCGANLHLRSGKTWCVSHIGSGGAIPAPRIGASAGQRRIRTFAACY